MPQKKKKRDLIATFQVIERFHRRRLTFVLHSVISLVVQAAMWINWYTSYQINGVGFDDDFFSPRLVISVVLALALAGHFALMRLTESKDRLVIEALTQHEDELESDEGDEDELSSQDEPDLALINAEESLARQTR